mgnify:CR=1 FL=1
MQDFSYDFEEHEMEIENRIRNLMWTVSGDYALNTRLDVASFSRNKYISLYDAIKQGAFAKYFDSSELSMYIVKKLFYGVEEPVLMNIAQLCVDMAVYQKIAAERPGVANIRKKAFEAMLDLDFRKMNDSFMGRVKLEVIRQFLNGRGRAEKRIQDVLDVLYRLEETDSTMEIIRTIDWIYNSAIDRSFERKHGDLDFVLRTSVEELAEATWQDFLDENATEASLEEMMRQANSSTLPEDEEEAEEKKHRAGKILITEEDIKKMYSYIELHFGTSYMDAREQERLNRRICRGIHADCKLYFTEGILKGCVRENNTYVLAKRTSEMNERFYRQNQRISRHNIAALGDILKRSLQARNEDDTQISDYGTVIPQKLWKVGRTSDTKLFLKQFKKNNSDFVVDVLIDASGSQRSRQHMIALQGYILSAALTRAGIPHRVLSFCSFWDYTVMRRFREYDDPAEADWNLMEFTSSSNNRDGLALRAAADGLLARPEENKVLIVLSDGRPNDLVVNRPNAKNPAVYTGDYAVKDTASEVRRLRSQGISVLGVFAGEEQDLQAERKIFGKDFAYIRELSTFAHVVGRYLRKQLDEQN